MLIIIAKPSSVQSADDGFIFFLLFYYIRPFYLVVYNLLQFFS